MHIIFDGEHWLTPYILTDGDALFGDVPVTKGGTGASDAATARANLGAAPAGLVSSVYYVTSLADFESRIEEVYNSMENCTERVIQMDLTSGTAEVHSGDWYITIVRRSANNGFLRMTKSLDSVVSQQRYRYDGSWGPWTWETPLMKPGVEYRTTERWNGNSVYTKLVNIGALPNNSNKNTESLLPYNITAISVFGVGVNGKKTAPIPSRHTYVSVDGEWGTLYVTADSDYSAYTGYIIVKYTKN